MRRLVSLQVKASPGLSASAVLSPVPIIMSDSADHAELDTRDDDSLVFARVGQGVHLCPQEEDQSRHNDVPLTSAADYGVICVGDANGVHIISTSDVVQHLEAMRPKAPFVIQEAAKAAIHTGATCASFNCDGSVLAAWHEATVSVYHVQELLQTGDAVVAFSWEANGGTSIPQFCWSPTDPKQCALVTDSGQLLLGRLGEPLQAIEAYSAVTSASWSLDGQLLAVGSGRHVHVYNAQRHTACFSTQVESQDDPDATVDTVIWASPYAILVCLDSGPDADQAPMAMITWQAWDANPTGADPEGLLVQSAGFCDVQPDSYSQQSPHMMAVFIPQWNLLLAVHRNSHNYHLKVFEVPQDGSPPVFLYLATDLMLDLQDGGRDNYITGIALDLTNTETVDPIIADKDPLPPMPRVLLTTADHKLQIWDLKTEGLSTEGLVHPPLPIPAPPAFQVARTLQAGKAESAQATEGGSALLSASSQGSGTQGSGTHASATQGSGTQDSGTQGSGTLGSATQGSGTQDSGTQGSGTLGSATQGSGTQDSGTQGSGNQEPATQDETAAAAQRALPDDDDNFEEDDQEQEEGEGESEGPAPEEQEELPEEEEEQEAEVQQNAAAGTALPSDDDDFEEEGEEEEEDREEASTHLEEEGTAESSVAVTSGKGRDDIDSDAEESSVTQQHARPAKLPGLHSRGSTDDDGEEEGELRHDSASSAGSSAGSSSIASPAPRELKEPSALPAASQTPNLSQPHGALAPTQSGFLAEPGLQNLAGSGVPSSNLFGALAVPSPSSASAFGALAGVPSSNPFGKPFGVPSASSSSASPAALFGGLSSAGSQALPLFGSAPSNAFGLAGSHAFDANASAASSMAPAPFGFGSAAASRQGSGLFGLGSAAPSQQGSGGSALGSAPASSPFGAGLLPSGKEATPTNRQTSSSSALQDPAHPSATPTAAGHDSTAPLDGAPDPHGASKGSIPSLPLGMIATGASQFVRATSLQVPSAFGETPSQPFPKGPTAAPDTAPVQSFGKSPASAFGATLVQPFGKGPTGSTTFPTGDAAVNVQASQQLDCAKPEPTSKLQPAPSDAELRAQAAESRLSRQVRQARQAQQLPAMKPQQFPATEAQRFPATEAQQFPAAEAQHAQQAGSVTAHQAPQQATVGQDLSKQAAQAALPDLDDEEEGQLNNGEEEDDPAGSASSEGEAASEPEEEEERMAEVSMPEAKLHGEGAQVEALEADFLQDLYKVRQLKAATSQALHKVRGRPGGTVKTILGYNKLVQGFEAMAMDAHKLQAAQKRSRRQLDELLESAKDEVRQVDALTHFHAPDQSLTSLSQKALTHSRPLAPALDTKRTQLLTRTAELRRKAREVDACLQALEARKALQGAAPNSPQSTAVQLYAVINAQSGVVKAQLERLEALMSHARMYSLPVDDLTAPSDSDEEGGDKVVGVKAAQQRLQSIRQLYGTPGRSPSSQTPPRSPASPWQSVKKSPASQAKPLLSWAHSPSSSSKAVVDKWSSATGQKLKQKLRASPFCLSADAAQLRDTGARSALSNGPRNNNSPTKGLLGSSGPSGYKSQPSNITFPVSSSNDEGSAVTMQSIHMQSSQAGLGSVHMQSVMDSQRSNSLSRQESGASVQSPFQLSKGTAAGAVDVAKKKGQLQGRPAPAPASKAPLAFTPWGLPQAPPPAAAPSRSKTPGVAISGPAPGASKKKSAQAGSFPPIPSKAQQQEANEFAVNVLKPGFTSYSTAAAADVSSSSTSSPQVIPKAAPQAAPKPAPKGTSKASIPPMPSATQRKVGLQERLSPVIVVAVFVVDIEFCLSFLFCPQLWCPPAE
ncbi:hypothetical protein ABBQ32_003220 [Trebouxia sp. C0010 RCD-2024]